MSSGSCAVRQSSPSWVRSVGRLFSCAITAHSQQTDKEKDTFLSLISHEIKSPLTSIKGFAQLAVRAIEADDEPLRRAAKHLRVIEQQADRIGYLISDLSDVSRMQRGSLQLDPTVFDLVPVIHSAVEQQQPSFGTHRIILKLPDEPLIMQADPRRIQQVLGNLLSNAAKSSPLADRVEVSLERHGEEARLAVRDYGIGISAEEQARIFDRFYRTVSGGGSGLGLGLYIAQQIARHSNGTLTVESEPGNGSTFCLDLPLAQPEASRRRLLSRPSHRSRGLRHSSRPTIVDQHDRTGRQQRHADHDPEDRLITPEHSRRASQRKPGRAPARRSRRAPASR